MEPRLRLCVLILFITTTISKLPASAFTEPPDVTAILDLYASFNYPPQLKEWRSDGGDPCEELWTGVACFESSIIYLKLDGLNLSGSLGGQLRNLYNLKQLDLSSNNIGGGIPDNLPPNITHLNLASNYFNQSLPLSFSSLKNLRHLNLSNNFLSGAIENAFTGLEDLREMDLSYNNFTGDLPISFVNMENLTELYLQNNQFTGAVTLLANLPLTSLNIEDNQFSGLIPQNFQNILNLWFDDNNFDGADSSIWEYPLISVTNISSPPTTQSSTMENTPALKAYEEKKKKHLSRGVVACIAAGATVVSICMVALVSIHLHRAQSPSNTRTLSEPPLVHYLESPKTQMLLRLSSVKSASDVLFPRNSSSGSVKVFSLEQLRLATDGFSQERLIDEGPLGSVYRAEFQDGQILAVKVINSMASEEDEFLQVTRTAHRLRHPNIVSLVGYCTKQGQRILVYEYVKSLSLKLVLHSNGKYRPLPWSRRLQIAVEIASALEYMHYELSPPVFHGNLKTANVLLDEELRARISDCGLALLRMRKSISTKLKAFTVIEENSSYRTVVEHGVQQPGGGLDNSKMDVYAFGVLMLELLTGRRPFDGSRERREEKCLVKWALPRLHDIRLLEEMVDPTIRGTVSHRALSRFADTITLCLQPEEEYRPSISGLVESLVILQEWARAAEERNELEPSFIIVTRKSFGSTNTAFFGSPTSLPSQC